MCDRKQFRLKEFLGAMEPKPTPDFTPTDAYPGCSEKVEVLRERAERGLPLWHRDDFRLDMGDDE